MRIGELPALEALDLLDLCTLCGESLLKALDQILVGLFFAGGIESKEDFVSVFHGWIAVFSCGF